MNDVTKKRPSRLADFTEAETEIYDLYPRRQGGDHKYLGLKKIRLAIRDVGFEVLKVAVVAFAAQMEREGKVGTFFVPMCKTWIGGKCYLNPPDVVPKRGFHPGTCFERCVRCNTRADLSKMRLEPIGYVCRGGCREESQA